ncbi:MAG: hypothetical protein KJP18_12820, partial [Gemmatimonadetes bacterium]|nr:hypothetical protein [Gemmatimonadota bacterium]
GGLAAALLPGSPLRSWITADAPSMPAAAGPATTAADAPGIRSAVVSERAEVLLVAPPGVEVGVYRVGERAGVFGPVEARFRVEGGRLHAESSTGPLRVELPPSVRDAEVTVNGVLRVVLRDGELVTAPESLAREPDLLVRFRVQ